MDLTPGNFAQAVRPFPLRADVWIPAEGEAPQAVPVPADVICQEIPVRQGTVRARSWRTFPKTMLRSGQPSSGAGRRLWLRPDTGAISGISIADMSKTTGKLPQCRPAFKIGMSGTHIRRKASSLPVPAKNSESLGMVRSLPSKTAPAFDRPDRLAGKQGAFGEALSVIAVHITDRRSRAKLRRRPGDRMLSRRLHPAVITAAYVQLAAVLLPNPALGAAAAGAGVRGNGGKVRAGVSPAAVLRINVDAANTAVFRFRAHLLKRVQRQCRRRADCPPSEEAAPAEYS